MAATNNSDKDNEENPYDCGRWVVLEGFTDDSDLMELNGKLAKIVDDDDVDDRYLVEIPDTDDTEHIPKREPFIVDKCNLLPALTARMTIAMEVSSFRDESGEVTVGFNPIQMDCNPSLVSNPTPNPIPTNPLSNSNPCVVMADRP